MRRVVATLVVGVAPPESGAPQQSATSAGPHSTVGGFGRASRRRRGLPSGPARLGGSPRVHSGAIGPGECLGARGPRQARGWGAGRRPWRRSWSEKAVAPLSCREIADRQVLFGHILSSSFTQWLPASRADRAAHRGRAPTLSQPCERVVFGSSPPRAG